MSSNEQAASVQDLAAYLNEINPKDELLIGIELERTGKRRADTSVVPYEGDNGFCAVFHKLVEEVGWEAVETSGEDIYELQRGETRITIEGDGRPELSGSPQEDLHALTREFRLHSHELKEMGDIFNIAWISTGFDPFHENKEIPMVKKGRYDMIMDLGGHDHWTETYLKRVNGMTVNFSYTDEENAIAKAQTAIRILPIVGAMYASSPFESGKLSGYLDMRRHQIQDWPLKRTGIPSAILNDDFSFEQWIEFYLDISVMSLKKGEEEIIPKNLTFRSWMENGYEGVYPTRSDFDFHVKSVWSDLRMRPSYLEYRVADSVPLRLAMSLPALIKGLVFDSESWEQVAQLTKGWTFEDVIDADTRAWKTGLQTEVHGRPLLTYAQELVTIANEKLHRFERTDASGNDESVYLEALKEQMYIKEKSPAEELVSLYEGEWNGDISRMVEWCEKE